MTILLNILVFVAIAAAAVVLMAWETCRLMKSEYGAGEESDSHDIYHTIAEDKKMFDAVDRLKLTAGGRYARIGESPVKYIEIMDLGTDTVEYVEVGYMSDDIERRRCSFAEFIGKVTDAEGNLLYDFAAIP